MACIVGRSGSLNSLLGKCEDMHMVDSGLAVEIRTRPSSADNADPELDPRPEWPAAGPDERCRVMLIYPNYRGMNMLPPAIGLLSAVLLEGGHEVQVFDTTYYESVDGETELADSDGKKSEQLMARLPSGTCSWDHRRLDHLIGDSQ